jgi:hypothetical protein
MNKGWLYLETWAGCRKHPIELVKETPKRYAVKLLDDNMKGKAFAIIYAPKYAVSFDDEVSDE